MSTRSGDVSAGIIIFLLKNGWTIKELERTLNHESGLLGVSGESENFGEVLEHALAGDAKSRLAVDMYVYRARKYLGAYWLGLPGLAAVSLTGDVAEEIPYVRQRIFGNLHGQGGRIALITLAFNERQSGSAADFNNVRRRSAESYLVDCGCPLLEIFFHKQVLPRTRAGKRAADKFIHYFLRKTCQ